MMITINITRVTGVVMIIDHGDGEDVVKRHALGSYVSQAKGLQGLGPPDPRLVHRRPHLHLQQ